MNGTARVAPGGGTGPATVADYAAEVRTHLADLPQDQVDDLTDGLEADLADALADPAGRPADMPPGLTARFGAPAEYARELRAAAGLPDPGPQVPVRRGPRERLRAGRATLRAVALRATAGLRAQPWWPGVRDFGLAVRPLWWVLRAWVVYQVVLQMVGGRYANGGGKGGWVPSDLLTWVVLGALVVVSVQWGRGLWLPRSGRWLPTAVGTGAVVLLLPAMIWASTGAIRWEYQNVESSVVGYPQGDGVWVDGMQVSNLFVYDAEGNPLQDVQVYDDRGRAVRTTLDDGWGGEYQLPGVERPWSFVPSWDADGRKRWNVYPLSGAPVDEFEWTAEGEWAPTGKTRTPPWPFAKAPAVLEDGAPGAASDGTVTDPGADTGPGQVVDPEGGDAPTQDQSPAPSATSTP